MKQVRITARILIGLVFIFSGFVKGVDPMGSAIKFTEYFEVFHLGWLEHLSLVLSVVLSTAEFLIGICLVVGLRMMVTAWAAILFIVLFTLLTLYSAIYSPVTDCGCFGDALVITNWQTFYKNIFLLSLAIVVFLNRRNYESYAKCFSEWVLTSLFAACMVCISLYGLKHLPILDFRPYHVGTNIYSKMIIPEGAPSRLYETTLFYKKNGVIKEFKLENFPTGDSTWIFVKSENVIIREGYTPPIRNFSISQEDGQDITNVVLSDSNYSFVFISPDLKMITQAEWTKIQELQKYVMAKGYMFYFLTGSPQNVVASIKGQLNLGFSFSFTDVTTLKTIIRANPGLLLLKDGTILAHWNAIDFPKPDELNGNLLSYILTKQIRDIEHKRTLLLGSLLILSFVIIWFLKQKK